MSELTFNIEARVSQGAFKRLLVQQALHLTGQPRCLVLNDVYLPEVEKILGDNILIANKSKKEFLLSDEIISDPKKRLALSNAYLSIDRINSIHLNNAFVSSALLVIEMIAKTFKEHPPYTLGRLINSSADEITDDIKAVKPATVPSGQKKQFKAISGYLQKSEGINTFMELLNGIWRLHKGFMIKGEFQKPHTWQKDNNLIVIPASELQKDGYSKVLFEYFLNDQISVLLDSDTPLPLYSAFLSDFEGNMSISFAKGQNPSMASNIAFKANKMMVSVENFDAELFCTWLAKYDLKLLKKYSINDFETAFKNYQFASYSNSFLGAEDDSLFLYRINDKNELSKRKFDLAPVLKILKKDQAVPQPHEKEQVQQTVQAPKIDESKIAKTVSEAVSTDIAKAVEEAVKPLIEKINELEKTQTETNQQLKETVSSPPSNNWDEMESIDNAFQDALKNQPDTNDDWS